MKAKDPVEEDASSEQNGKEQEGPSLFKQKDDDDNGGDGIKITDLATRRKLKPGDSLRGIKWIFCSLLTHPWAEHPH
jgi:hypothetical protein